MKSKNFVIVAHKFVTTPEDQLVTYLNEKEKENVIHITHRFVDLNDNSSHLKWFKRGVLFKELHTGKYTGWPLPLIYFKELWFTLFWLLRTEIHWDYYIGIDGLCVLFGNILRMLKRVQKTVYWAMDFVPAKRFSNPILNKLYHLINTSGYKSSDQMWDLSPRMAESREKFLGIRESDYKERKVVPYGVWLNKIKKYSYADCERTTIVFMGHLIEKQGAQLVIKALPKVISKVGDAKFKIIGTGAYVPVLKELATQLNVQDHCIFMGKIEDHTIVEDEIAKSCIAVAPYIKELDTWTYYADPGKVKEYLACGVPLLLTDVPWNAQEIANRSCGKIVTEDINELADNIISMMDPSVNQIYRNNALEYAKSFDYGHLFDALGF